MGRKARNMTRPNNRKTKYTKINNRKGESYTAVPEIRKMERGRYKRDRRKKKWPGNLTDSARR